MRKTTFMLAAALATGSLSLPATVSAQTATTTPTAQQQEEAKHHELACTAATVGGAVVGAAVGSLLGGGLGKTLFEVGGAALGLDRGRNLKCGANG